MLNFPNDPYGSDIKIRQKFTKFIRLSLYNKGDSSSHQIVRDFVPRKSYIPKDSKVAIAHRNSHSDRLVYINPSSIEIHFMIAYHCNARCSFLFWTFEPSFKSKFLFVESEDHISFGES